MPAVRRGVGVGADRAQLEAERAALEKPPHHDRGQEREDHARVHAEDTREKLPSQRAGGDWVLSLPGRWKASLLSAKSEQTWRGS